ncbi:MAG: HNH endonuclease [Candidatus Peregrinibacteria bacterium]|nr:HNH endonuclease [Candidatus Peregrinibacteria bacterium]
MNQFQYSPPKNQPVSTDDIIEDLQSVAKKLKTEKLSQSLYVTLGKYDPSTITRRFGTWNKAVQQIGLKPGNINNYSDEKLFENILNIWQHKGKQPTRRDLDFKPSVITQSPYNRRFNSWSVAMKEFIEYANGKDITSINKDSAEKSPKKTSRDPSLRLRFKVLKRDNFSCVQCGASPAKNSETILHVDHIKPWSNGGETEILNLQTLCQNCNLGKSNLE